MYNAAASNGANKPKKERKLTVIFKHTTADQVRTMLLRHGLVCARVAVPGSPASCCLASEHQRLTDHILMRMQHVAGVEALAVAPDSSSLYTASRDSLVKR